MLSSFFYLLAAALLLFLLLGLSACSGNFCIAEGRGHRTTNLPMSSSKSIFFLAASRPPLLISLVLVELSSLNKPWSMDSLSGVTASYLAEHHPVPVAVLDVNWFASRKCHSRKCYTQMAAKHREEHLTTLNHGPQTW